jgi:hypothetical protein
MPLFIVFIGSEVMSWTEENEAEFQRKKAEWFAEQAREDEEHRKRVERGLAPKCPHCGSHRYVEGTWAEECSSCGYSQGY